MNDNREMGKKKCDNKRRMMIQIVSVVVIILLLLIGAGAGIFLPINEHKSEAIVKMHEGELSDHSQKGRLFPAILGKVKNK